MYWCHYHGKEFVKECRNCIRDKQQKRNYREVIAFAILWIVLLCFIVASTFVLSREIYGDNTAHMYYQEPEIPVILWEI
jgi:multisubunit Na+/H+ antiporter MnhB subunit